MIAAHTIVCLFTDVPYPWGNTNTEKYSTKAALREFSMTLIIYFVLISYRISETGESKENAGVSTQGIIIWVSFVLYNGDEAVFLFYNFLILLVFS